MITNKELEQLVKEFGSLPKVVQLPTYLELCQYPYRRFEEICSKLLSFYLQPTGEHGMNDLFIQSLIQAIGEESEFEYRSDKLQIIVEDNAEGKRIDLVVIGENFVIGIENKITANLYNPLDTYSKKLLTYNREHVKGVVLSLHKVSRRNEVEWMRANGFVNILYAELFNSVKQNIGFYLGQCSDKYLTYLKDFMTTIENMQGNNILNQPLSDFFFENSEKVDELVKLYSDFNNEIIKIQNRHISSLQESLTELTSHEWWIWSGFDLGYTFKVEGHKLGIESSFQRNKKNPIGKFNIQISTWSIKDWNYFKNLVTPLFPNVEVQLYGGKANLIIDTLLDADEEQISTRLVEIFNLLKEQVVVPLIAELEETQSID